MLKLDRLFQAGIYLFPSCPGNHARYFPWKSRPVHLFIDFCYFPPHFFFAVPPHSPVTLLLPSEVSKGVEGSLLTLPLYNTDRVIFFNSYTITIHYSLWRYYFSFQYAKDMRYESKCGLRVIATHDHQNRAAVPVMVLSTISHLAESCSVIAIDEGQFVTSFYF